MTNEQLLEPTVKLVLCNWSLVRSINSMQPCSIQTPTDAYTDCALLYNYLGKYAVLLYCGRTIVKNLDQAGPTTRIVPLPPNHNTKICLFSPSSARECVRTKNRSIALNVSCDYLRGTYVFILFLHGIYLNGGQMLGCQCFKSNVNAQLVRTLSSRN